MLDDAIWQPRCALVPVNREAAYVEAGWTAISRTWVYDEPRTYLKWLAESDPVLPPRKAATILQ